MDLYTVVAKVHSFFLFVAKVLSFFLFVAQVLSLFVFWARLLDFAHMVSRLIALEMSAQPAIVSEQKLCTECKRPTREVCSRCKQMPYCSAEHQKKHWKQHRPNCVPRGLESQQHVKKGILLPFDSPTPEIVHVACEVLEPDEDDDIDVDWICKGEFIDSGRPTCRRAYTIEFQRFGPPSKRLDNYLQLTFSDTFAIDGSPPNKCAILLHHNFRVNLSLMYLRLDVCAPWLQTRPLTGAGTYWSCWSTP
ncbi:hypothetical protein BC629DRAFT_870633 [Irpex lacteus]|nr:hypothetical protein BC629DRAFT_870633 [Irpex lacteus]